MDDMARLDDDENGVVAALSGTIMHDTATARRPLLVAVDGVDGAGKTTFADTLAGELRECGTTVVRASIDDFHHSREHRHRLGRTSQAIWARHLDYRALRRELIDPWLAGAGASYRRAWHDVRRDEYVECEPDVVPESGVLLVDGLFAQRPELAQAWDLVVFLDVPFEVSVARMAARDGTPADPDHPDQARYVAAQRHYFASCEPSRAADVLIDNADAHHPRLVAWGSAGSATGSGPWISQGDDLVKVLRVPKSDPDRARRIDEWLTECPDA
jgi:uridine kinase